MHGICAHLSTNPAQYPIRRKIIYLTIKDKDQLELDLTESNSNIRVFSPKQKSTMPKKSDKEDPKVTEELMEKGLEIFAQELSDDAKGFFALIFDTDNNPRIVWGGSIDMIAALGSLEMAKQELYNNIFIDVEAE